jgi:hypothetical protein
MKRLAFIFSVLATAAMADPITAEPLPPAAVAAPQPEPAVADPKLFEQVKDREEAAARELIGDPLIARAEGLGAMWTYQQPDCVLFVFFTSAAPGEPRRLSAISSGPRRRGDVVPPPEECLAAQMASANPEPAHKGTHRPGG